MTHPEDPPNLASDANFDFPVFFPMDHAPEAIQGLPGVYITRRDPAAPVLEHGDFDASFSADIFQVMDLSGEAAA